MKNIVLSILGLFVFLLITLTITTNLDRPGEEVIFHEEYEQYLIDNNINPELFTSSQKEKIYNCELVLKDTLYDGNYVVPSASPIEFSRHWGVSSIVDTEMTSDLEVSAYYFESDRCDKIILLTFKSPYHVTLNQSYDFLHVSYSNNYNLSISGHVSYIDKGNEYILKNIYEEAFITGEGARPYDISGAGISLVTNDIYSNNQIGIPYNDDNLGYFHYPDIVYSYTIQLTNSIDNQTPETDDYVGLDIDFYQVHDFADYSVAMGFNEFKQSVDNRNMYVVKRISLSHKREES